MQYAHLYPAYVNSNGLAPLETNVIKSHDCKFLYVKIAAVSSHIIFHKKNMRRPCSRTSRCPQNVHNIRGLAVNPTGPLVQWTAHLLLVTTLRSLDVAACFFWPKMSKTMVGQTIIFPSFWVVLSLVLCVLISCPNTFVGYPIIPGFDQFPWFSRSWGRHRRFLKDIGIVPQIILDGIDLDELPNHKTGENACFTEPKLK